MVINVGNTRLAVGAFVAGELQDVVRVAHADRAGCQRALEQAWETVRQRDGAAIAGVSVNPAAMEAVEHLVHAVVAAAKPGGAAPKVQWVGREIDLPIKVLTDPPTDTGVDRILNVAAAYEQIGKACVVVDAGTAITVNCCNDKGEFLGGAIAPGVAMILDALHERTARLPRVELAVPKHPFGSSTAEAIRHGVYHGIRGMVKELLENYATELGAWPELIATGGDAALLFDQWELVHAIAPDLTLYGIALAYAEHHIKHRT